MAGAMHDSWAAEAVPDCVPALRNAVVAFAEKAGVPEPPLENLRLAVSEAITNVVLHGYPADETGSVEVHAETTRDRVRVTVADRGTGYAPRLNSPGAGLGMPIIAAVADAVEIRHREPSGTEVELSFRLTG